MQCCLAQSILEIMKNNSLKMNTKSHNITGKHTQRIHFGVVLQQSVDNFVQRMIGSNVQRSQQIFVFLIQQRSLSNQNVGDLLAFRIYRHRHTMQRCIASVWMDKITSFCRQVFLQFCYVGLTTCLKNAMSFIFVWMKWKSKSMSHPSFQPNQLTCYSFL